MINNESSFGGAIDCHYGSSPMIINNFMSRNKTDDGGGIYCYEGCSPLIRNNIIVDNAANYGGGIHCRYSCSPFVDQNTIAGNSAFSGGGLRIIFDCSPTLRNNIFWGNDATVGDELYFGESCGPSILYTDVQGGRESVYLDPGWLPQIGPGLIDQEPGFVSYGALDYLLLPGSPCIDSGDPSVVDGMEWPEWYPDGSRSDMGAYGGPDGVNWLQ